MNNLYFLLISFVYLVLVSIIYFYKEKIKTIENKIFSVLIVTSLLGIVLDFISVYMAFSGFHNLFFQIVNKFYLIYLLTWISLITLYTIIISLKKHEKSKLVKLIKFVYPIAIIVLLISPLNYSIKDTSFYTYGASANIMYIISNIYIFVMLICVFSNFKEIKQKKYYPIIFYIIIGTTITLIQLTNPSILIITAMETFVTILMFFTIENPDVKLIEQLNIARNQADRANEAKTEFLSSMSHEIRTPLNAIVGFSQTLAEDDDLSPRAREQAKDILMASDNLLEIVNGVLDISKIEANKLEIVMKEYNFEKVFDDLILLTKVRLGEKPIEFKVHLDSTIPPVLYGDYVRTKQVILNLLTNAAKYTDSGFIEFKVNTYQKGSICRLIISVEDSGFGIKKEEIDKLFSKFERIDVEKNITIEGTGLGLAITKKLVDLMGGKIVVQSVYGKGSKFTVALDQKIMVGKEFVEEKVNTNEVVDVAGKKVLLVDDNKLNLKVASLLLEKYKLDITTFSSGFECIDSILNGDKYDLILLDDMMPKMSGVETLKKLKNIEGFDTCVVALTANAISGMRDKYLNDGFNDYLAKPINKQELDKVVKKYLNK